MKISDEIKNILEESGVSLATVNELNRPHVIIVSDVKVISENKVLIADNFMKETVANIKKNNNVSIMAWDKKNDWSSKGYEIRGTAEYFTEGKWKEEANNIDSECKTKGAILVTVEKIKKLS